MILYLDTSSLVKLYLEEDHSDSVRRWVEEAEIVATSRVAYPEAMAAFVRRFREGNLSKKGFGSIHGSFSKEWPQIAAIGMDEIAAGELAIRHGLRGFDAIHLEAAVAARNEADDALVTFSSFDEKLNAAAVGEGFQILDDDNISL